MLSIYWNVKVTRRTFLLWNDVTSSSILEHSWYWYLSAAFPIYLVLFIILQTNSKTLDLTITFDTALLGRLLLFSWLNWTMIFHQQLFARTRNYRLIRSLHCNCFIIFPKHRLLLQVITRISAGFPISTEISPLLSSARWCVIFQCIGDDGYNLLHRRAVSSRGCTRAWVDSLCKL